VLKDEIGADAAGSPPSAESAFSVNDQVAKALDVFVQRLGTSVIAVYLHGSAVSSGLCPHSDIDLMVIVDRPIGRAGRSGLVSGLMAVSHRHPAPASGPRSIDVIVFSTAELAALRYPARAEFVYGEWLRRDFEAGQLPMPQRDPEHTLLLAQARDQSSALTGPALAELAPRIAQADIRQAMRDVVPGLVEGLSGDERNVLLTLARIWYTAVTGAFVAKPQAAQWACQGLDGDAALLLDLARGSHLHGDRVDWASQSTIVQRTAQALRQHVLEALT
jgi:predicted nucleotidyltransferase